MKKISSVLLVLALIAMLFVSCDDDSASSASTPADPLDTVSVENFLKSYYAVFFMENGITVIPGDMYAQLNKKITGDTKTVTENVVLSTFKDETFDSTTNTKGLDRIKTCLSGAISECNDDSLTSFSLTEVTSPTGTLAYKLEYKTADSSTTTTTAETEVVYTTEVKDCDIAVSYRARTRADKSAEWQWADDDVKTGKVLGSYTEKETMKASSSRTATETHVCSNIALNVELDEDGVFEGATSTKAVSYKNIEFTVEYTMDDNSSMTFNKISSASYNGTVLTEEQCKQIQNILYN